MMSDTHSGKHPSAALPHLAVIDQNTLATIGLKNILLGVVPTVQIDAYGSFAEFEANQPERYFHYFVSLNIVLQHMDFFMAKRRQTIVLTQSFTPVESASGKFHAICVNQPENALVRDLLKLMRIGHPNGQHMPPMPSQPEAKTLTSREEEVMALIAQGLLNKEIAHQLNIGLATVVTHRRNIMEKLKLRSVSALTIYAVMHGYVDINKI